jgi:hypothetical protein
MRSAVLHKNGMRQKPGVRIDLLSLLRDVMNNVYPTSTRFLEFELKPSGYSWIWGLERVLFPALLLNIFLGIVVF